MPKIFGRYIFCTLYLTTIVDLRFFLWRYDRSFHINAFEYFHFSLFSSFLIVVDKSIDLVIPAHDTEVGAIAVNPDGTLIASASERGHIIKIYSTDAGEVVQELKRGNSKAFIENILFHPHQYILACTSSK